MSARLAHAAVAKAPHGKGPRTKKAARVRRLRREARGDK